MEIATDFGSLFRTWPEKLPRRGVLVTTFGEQIPFSEFLTGPAMVVLARSTPDSIGARQIVIRYDAIAALKITEVVKLAAFGPWGFGGPAAG